MASRVLFSIFLLSGFFGLANQPAHVTVTVEPGDAVYSLLRQYELQSHSCNISSFYKINNMAQGDHIHANKTYKLPLKIYNYNSTSIRSTIGNDNWDLAVAIQDYNKLLKQKGVKEYYMNDKTLYVPYHLIGCENPVTLAKDNVEKVEYIDTDIYFGESKLKKESDKLAGQVFYVISGHGGPDPGAMCSKDNNDLCEDEYAYDVSLRLAKNLLINGATVHFIIHDPNDGIRDETYLKMDRDEVSVTNEVIPLNQRRRLQQRVDAVNDLYYAEQKKNEKATHKVIAIHVDSRTTSLKQDVFFYHAPGSDSGFQLAHTIQNTFREKYNIHQKGRGYEGSVSGRNLFILRKTIPTAVYVELANIQNRHNQQRILPYTNRQVLANWLYEGLTK